MTVVVVVVANNKTNKGFAFTAYIHSDWISSGMVVQL